MVKKRKYLSILHPRPNPGRIAAEIVVREIRVGNADERFEVKDGGTS